MKDDFGDRMKRYEAIETARQFMPLLPVYAPDVHGLESGRTVPESGRGAVRSTRVSPRRRPLIDVAVEVRTVDDSRGHAKPWWRPHSAQRRRSAG